MKHLGYCSNKKIHYYILFMVLYIYNLVSTQGDFKIRHRSSSAHEMYRNRTCLSVCGKLKTKQGINLILIWEIVKNVVNIRLVVNIISCVWRKN